MRVFTMTLVALLLAGCLGGGAGDPKGAADGLPLDGTDAGPGANDTLSTRPLGVDPWSNGETARVLFSGSVEAAPCYDSTPFELTAGYVQAGCAEVHLPEGTVILPGTKTLVWEADATQAHKGGKWYPYIYTAGRGWPEADGEPTADKVHTWEFQLNPGDWDASDATTTRAFLGYWAAYDPANVLVGPIQTKITAIKDPEWVPLAPVPPTLLLDANATWVSPAGADLASARPERMGFAPIPANTTALSLSILWTVIECPVNHDCSPNAGLTDGTNRTSGSQRDRGTNHAIKLFAIPSPVDPDDSSAEMSDWLVDPFVWRCARDVPALPCFGSFYAFGNTVDVRVVVRAWTTPFDLDEEKALLGLA